MSRAFDNSDDINKIILSGDKFLEEETLYFNGRTPQVIEIIGTKIHLIRSSMKNTSIHLSRPSYKEKIHIVETSYSNRINELNNSINQLHMSLYYNKYIKYKNKYLALKK